MRQRWVYREENKGIVDNYLKLLVEKEESDDSHEIKENKGRDKRKNITEEGNDIKSKMG